MELKRLNRVYYPNDLQINHTLNITDDNFHYLINVLRLKNNNNIRIFNEKYGEFLGTIISIKKKSVSVYLNKQLTTIDRLTKTDITLAIAIIREHNLLTAIDMAVQIGVDRILPLITDYTQYKYNNAHRIYKRIIEATEQSNRLNPPILLDVAKLKNINSNEVYIYANEQELITNNINTLNLNFNQHINIIIGPEGGFSLDELNILKTKQNFYSFSLGANILRSETASIVALAELLYLKPLS